MNLLAKLFQWLILPWLVKKLKSLSDANQAHTPHFEVERKWQISDAEHEEIQATLKKLGFVRRSRATITDTFVPAENEGELIRIREEVSPDESVTVLTLKEWVDVAGSRERKETESGALDEVTRDCILALGRRLAKSELLSYSKERTTFGGFRDKHEVTVSFDRTSGLGQYSGSYMEVEVLVERQDGVPSARAFVESFARELLKGERESAMSYVEMLKRSRKKAS